MLNISLYAFWPFEIPLLRILSSSKSHFEIGLCGVCLLFVCLLESNFLSSLYISGISTLSDIRILKIFSQSLGCCSVLLTVSFALQKLFSFMKSHLSP